MTMLLCLWQFIIDTINRQVLNRQKKGKNMDLFPSLERLCGSSKEALYIMGQIEGIVHWQQAVPMQFSDRIIKWVEKEKHLPKHLISSVNEDKELPGIKTKALAVKKSEALLFSRDVLASILFHFIGDLKKL